MSEPLKQALGLMIREARHRAGLTQEELGARIKRTTETVSNIERGRQLPALDTLADLAGVLRVPMIELLATSEEKRSVSRQRAQLEAKLREIGRALSDRDLAVAVAQADVLLRQP